MSDRYTSEELTTNLVSLADFGEVNLSVGGVEGLIEAISSRLRCAESLLSAAKTGLLYMDHTGPLYSDHVCGDPNSSCDADCVESAQWAKDRERIRKAIADYVDS